MLITEIAIKRPVFAIMIMVAFVVIGAISYLGLGIEETPNVEFPIAVVNVTYPGASPEVIEEEVVKKIEEAVNPLEGVKRINSTSYEGLSNIVIQFQLERNKDSAMQDVRDAVSRLRRILPENIEEPVVRSYDPTALPIISLALTSETKNVSQLSNMAKETLKKRLESSYGVGQVSIIGEVNRQIKIELNPALMNEKKIGIEKVIQAVRQSNQEIPVGEIEKDNISQQVRVKGKILDPADFSNIIIATRGQIPIKLSDIATIKDDIEEPKSSALLDTKRIIAFDITKIRGANTVKTSEGILKKVEEINKTLPKNTSLKVIRDNSISIKDSVNELTSSMFIGILLTILIVYVFLNSWRSTVITGLTLPISLIASFAVMGAFGFTLNIMTLIALSLSVGLVIDDAIVVRENIVRHVDMGKNHFQAALDGTKEIGLAVMATTFTIVAVFIPIGFMGGMTCKFFTEFGITVASAVLVSLFVSFTLDPMLSSIWPDPRGHNSFIGKSLESFNQSFDNLAKAYRNSVYWVLEHPFITSFITLLLFIGSCALVPHLGGSFLPEQDKAQIRVSLKASVNMTLDYTERKAKEAMKIIKKKYSSEVEFIYASVGGGFSGEVSEGKLFVKLVPKQKRNRNQAAIMKALRSDLAQLGGIKAFVTSEGKGGPGGSPIQISVQGADNKLIEKLSKEIMTLVKESSGAVDIDTSLEKSRLNLNIDINRQKAADLGLNLSDISSALNYIFTGDKSNTWQAPNGEEYDVLIRLPKTLRNSEEILRNIRLTSSTESLIPLSQVASLSSDSGPSKIKHQSLLREITITGDVEGKSPGEVLKVIKTKLKPIEEGLPVGYKIVFGGEAEDLQEAVFYGVQALVLVVIFIYLIMASQFNSFIQPFAIMFTLPLALIGVFITLFLTKDTLNLMSMIGVITLMGLVTKNGILLIDFANQKRKEDNISLKEALAIAGETRLRPIIMTSLAAALGILPLALGLGAGSELRSPMARAIIGGIITSTILTLFVIPVVYSFLEYIWDFIRNFGKKKNL